MTQRIAQTLILTMTRAMSLSEWERAGLLEREWALYAALAPNYDRLVVVSHGDSRDLELAARIHPSPIVIANTERLGVLDYVASVPARIEAALGPIESAVIKTNQMDDAGLACSIAGWLRDRGVTCALIARCGYVRSQFLAAEHGSGSVEAMNAALIERTLTGAADLVVATTEQAITDLAWRDGLDAERVRVIPNYILDEACSGSGAQRETGLCVCVGQLVARKRVDRLIRAVAELRHDHQVLLEIIGSGVEEPSLRALADELEAPVTFCPRIPHHRVLERLGRASIYLQASALEGHPKTLMEAMACGAACIVADSPGLGNLIQNGVTGLCVSGEPETFAYAIAGLLEDACWREQLGACAAQIAHARFALSRVAELERNAHRAALALAASRSRQDDAMIRWNPALLHRTPDQIARAWTHALDAMLARLPAYQQQRVRSALRDEPRAA
ncbi:MAG: hypothetical protein Kow0022_17310 [Phycisphaerales bacterium]